MGNLNLLIIKTVQTNSQNTKARSTRTKLEIKTINFREISNDDISTFDIWIILAIVPSLSDFQVFRSLNPNCKIISYKCGNNYQLFIEEVIFDINHCSGRVF